MKIVVIHEDGTPETLTMIGEWNVREGIDRNRLIGPQGHTHFFRHSGEYDGWGTGMFEIPKAKDVSSLPDVLELKRPS